MKELIKALVNQGIITASDVQRLSTLELLLLIIERVNELHDLTKEALEIVDKLLNGGMRDEVIAQLNKWKEDGTLTQLINDTLFNMKLVNVLDFIEDGDFTQGLEKAIDYIKTVSINVNGNESEDIQKLNIMLRIPFGDYTYNGNGIDITGLESFKIVGDGMGSSRIHVSKDVYLFTCNDALTRLECSDIKFSGGKGYFNLTYSGSNVRAGIKITNCYFYGYSTCAIGSNAIDYPYWTIEDNVFYGTNNSIGLALPAGGDCSSISKNKFLYNKFHIKCRSGHGNKIINNDFIRFSSSLHMNDIWIVPNSGSEPFWDMRIENNKFGNENLTNEAKRILIADDLDILNYKNSVNYSQNLSTGEIRGLKLNGNTFSGGDYHSVIESYCVNFKDNYFSFTLSGSFPKYLIYIAVDTRLSNGGNMLNKYNIVEMCINSEMSTQKPPKVSNLDGLFKLIDVNGFYTDYNNHATNEVYSKETTFLIDSSKRIKDVAQSLGGSYFTNVDDMDGVPNNAITVNGYGFCFTINPVLNKKIIIEFTAKSQTPVDLVINFYTQGTNVFKQYFSVGENWSTKQFVTYNLSNEEINVEITPANGVTFSNLLCYQSDSTQPVNGISKVKCLDLQISDTHPKNGYGRIYFNGTDFKVIFPNGEIKKIQLLD